MNAALNLKIRTWLPLILVLSFFLASPVDILTSRAQATTPYSIGNDANDATLAVNSGSTNTINDSITASAKLIVSGYPETATVRVEVSVSAGAGQLKLSSLPAGVETATVTSSGATRQIFYGTQANVNSALNNLQYIAASTPAETQTASVISVKTSWAGVGGDGYKFNPYNGHFYKLFDPVGVGSWTEANAHIKNSANATTYTYQGERGYLANILDSNENAVILSINPGTAWLGGSDSTTADTWIWTDGPEAGTVFRTGTTANLYNNFSSGEPNASGEYLVMWERGSSSRVAGTWDDQANTLSNKYIVEYGGNSLPQEKTRTLSVNILPSVPLAPTNLVATTNVAGTAIDLIWTAPIARPGVTITGYVVKLSTNNFSTETSTSTGSTSTSYTINPVVADTQYYVRVSAVSAGGSSVNSNIALPSTFPACSPLETSVTSGGIGKTVLRFISTSTCRWNAPAPLATAAADYLVVGGGASGTRGLCGVFYGQGGGGGAVESGTATFKGTVTIKVGAGGLGSGDQSCSSAHTGNPGETSTVGVNVVSALGGKGGVSGTNSNTTLVGAIAIGRIGGASGNGNTGGIGTASNTQTSPNCSSPGLCGAGGGGGAGGPGFPKNGGIGLFSTITGSSIEYGSGGSGYDTGGNGTATGGGGDSGNNQAGEANTGAGGADKLAGFGAGGSGVIVIAFAGAPTITSVSPSSGSSAGGSITINGTNFASGSTAAIGSTALTSVVVVSSTRITATIPAIAAGVYNVSVTSGGQTATLSNGYTARSSVNVNFTELNFSYPSNHTNYPGGGRTAADCTTTTTACTGKLAGDKVLFKNVYAKDGVAVDAVVTTETITAGAVIQQYEVGTKAGGLASYFETDIRITSVNASVSFKFEFYYKDLYNNADPTLNRATLENVNVTGIDIDYGQFNYFTSIESYTRDSATRLTVSTIGTNPVVTRFQGSTSIGANDVKDQVVTNYSSFNTFGITFGSTKSDASNNALFGAAFKALEWGSATPVTTGGTSYNLTYAGNGSTSGTVPALQSGLVGQNMTVSTNSGALTRAGYTFNGWNTVADGSGIAYAAGSKYPMPKDGGTLYAQWVGVSYTLAYNANSGTGAPANQSSNAGQSVTISSTQPTRSGFTFASWNDAIGGGGSSYSASGSLTMPAANVTLYAQWTQITYTISYNANGGSGAPSSQTGAAGSAVTISNTAPTWDGYTFGGWNTSAAGTGTSYLSGASTTMPVGGINLYAKWTAISNYLLTYNANGGTGSPSPETRGSTETFNLSATTPTRSGYTFAGWDAAANGSGTDYTAGGSYTMSGANVSIYAKWTANTITVTYNGNTNTSGTPPITQSGAYGETVTASALGDLVKTGFTFNGWNTAAAGTGTSYLSGSTITLPVTNVILYAQWSANSYTISYNANGGINAPTSHSAATASTVTAKAIGSMSRTGYTFAGWHTTAAGTGGTDYTAGGSFTMPGNNLTLFAKWTPVPITITYVLGTANGTNVTGPTLPPVATVNFSDTHTVGSLSSETTTVSAQVYAFAGWSTGSNTYRPGNSITAGTTNITMTATWVALYQVKYLPNGGTPTSSASDSECPSGVCTDGQGIILDTSTVFTRTGYTFSKWTSQAGIDYDAGTSKNISATEYLFYAKWVANNNTLSYNVNGSDQSAPSNQTQATDSIATVANGITWAGYVFTGWNTAADGTGTSYAAGRTFTMPAENVILYAQWSALSYSVIYNANGGSNPPAVQSQSTGSTVTISGVGAMTRPGYTFAEWDGAADGSGTDYVSAATFTMPASNRTLYAKWTVNSYTITYNVNGGTGGPSGSETGNTGSTVTVSATDPTRTGYTFTGWNTSCDGTGTSYVASATFAMPVGGGTLCAQWAPIVSYLITYFANGGTSAPSAQAEAENATATVSTIGSMIRTGYTFTGWNTAADGTGTAQSVGSTFTMPNSNVALYAQWSVLAYNLSYDVNGGSSSVATQSGNSGSTVTVNSTAPIRSGYTFISWTTVADGSGDSYAPAANFTILASNTILYAQWNINSFTLAYDANGGSNAPSNASTAFNATVTASAVGSLTRNGYTFTGWNSAANSSGTNYIAGTSTFNMPASDVTLFAQWAPASFLLTYNANGGSGAPGAQGSLVDAAVTVSATTPIKSGYTFAGWSENADGTGTPYASSSTFTMPPNNLTIFAKWTAITYTLTYLGNTNTGGAAPAVQTGNVGGAVTISSQSTLAKTGYTFTGWNTAANFSGTGFAVGGSYVFAASNQSLHAHWVADIYKLIFNANGGSTPPVAQEVATNANVTVPTAGSMSRAGYTFAGWTENADGTGTVYINGTGTATFAMPGAITTLYAKWTPIEYNVVYFANGGSGTVPDTQTDSVTATVSIQEPTQLSKSNSVFTGWNTRADGTGIGYTSLTYILMPLSGLDLYAQWSGVAYTIAYNANGGTSAPTPQTGIAGTEVTLAPVEPLKPSNTFAVWSVIPNGGSTTYTKGGILTMPSNNLVLYAQWSAIVVTEPTPETQATPSAPSIFIVAYDSNTATSGQVPVDIKRYINLESVTVAGNTGSLSKDGFSFNGWNTKADGSGTSYPLNTLNTFTISAQSVVLYAQWVVIGKYSLTYNGNGATAGTTPVESKKLTTGETFTIQGNTDSLALPRSIFDGWNTKADGTGTKYAPGSTVVVEKVNITLFAQWKVATTYVVTFNGNAQTGGSVPVDTNRYVESEIVSIPENTGKLVKTEFTFVGWNSARDGSGISYPAGGAFKIGNANITLYAMWKKNAAISTTSKKGTLKFEVFYALNSFFLDAKNRKVIESKIAAAKKKLTSKSKVTISIVGWVQPTRISPNIKWLSTNRAQVVAKYMRVKGFKGTYILKYPGHDKDNIPAARHATVTITWTNSK